jgi:hypothetical protein
MSSPSGHTNDRDFHLCHFVPHTSSHPVLTLLPLAPPSRPPLPPPCPPAAADDPEGLEAQVAALLGAAGSLSAHAMAEADDALAPKVSTTRLSS